MNYYEYLHTDTSNNTVAKLTSDPISIAKKFNGNEAGLLNFADGEGVTNRQRIWNMYSDKETLSQYPTPNSVNAAAPLLPNTLLYIPVDDAFNEIVAIIGKDTFKRQQNLKAFFNEELVNLLSDPSYVKSSVVRGEGNRFNVNILHQTAQVWVWCRALNRIINVTKYLRTLDTEVSTSGAFSLSLSPVMDPEQDLTFNGNRISYTQITANDRFRTPFFHKYIQQNDIFFIRFEKLDLEEDREELRDKLYIEKADLPNQVYDMIGLVDSNVISHSPFNNEPNVNITGRDFSKLLTEDGAYFLPFVLLENSQDFFVNTGSDNKFFKRLLISGDYKYLFFHSLRSIKDTLGFIFNQLTNTGVLPDGVNLFSSYADFKVSKTYQISGADKRYLDAVEQNGVWKIVKLVVDNGLDDRRIANSDITRPDGTLMEQVTKVCQAPFVEFWGDTYGDTFTFITRQPPFTKEAIIDYLDNFSTIEIESKDVSNVTLSWETEYYSWYQIMPENSFLGKSQFIAAAYIPVVYLPEYVNAFGNHRKSVPTNYISYQAISGDSGKTNTDLYRRAVAEDLKYIIETTAYLPFTRRGTITIKGGDRRIKRGTFVELEATGEVFYVDAVKNSMRCGNSDIDRETVLTVSRGMVKQYIKGRFLNGKLMSYFSIVNTENIRDAILTRIDNGQLKLGSTKSNIIVDKDVFDFFISRKQIVIGNEFDFAP